MSDVESYLLTVIFAPFAAHVRRCYERLSNTAVGDFPFTSAYYQAITL